MVPVTSPSSGALGGSRSANSVTAAPTVAVVLCCDKCDGKHETSNCPHYKKKRDDHPDAQKNKQIGGHSSLPGSILVNARVVRQPGDGSCLFHSMSYGLRTSNASSLRAEICRFIQNNPNLRISDTPLQDWVRCDSGASVSEYARNMSRGSWGGGIEMACLSQLKNCNVHVYERHRMGFKRISAFDHPLSPESKPVIKVLYGGGVHYGKHHTLLAPQLCSYCCRCTGLAAALCRPVHLSILSRSAFVSLDASDLTLSAVQRFDELLLFCFFVSYCIAACVHNHYVDAFFCM